MSEEPERLRQQAKARRALARDLRNAASYADRHEARNRDLAEADRLERSAAELEGEADALERHA